MLVIHSLIVNKLLNPLSTSKGIRGSRPGAEKRLRWVLPFRKLKTVLVKEINTAVAEVAPKNLKGRPVEWLLCDGHSSHHSARHESFTPAVPNLCGTRDQGPCEHLRLGGGAAAVTLTPLRSPAVRLVLRGHGRVPARGWRLGPPTFS